MTDYSKDSTENLFRKLSFAEENGDSVDKNMLLGELLSRGAIKRKKRSAEQEDRQSYSIGREKYRPVLDSNYVVVEEYKKDFVADKESDGYQEKWK